MKSQRAQLLEMLPAFVALLWLVVFLSSGTVLAQDPEQATETDELAAGQAPKTKSGYEDLPQFGGPTSTGAQLEEDNAIKMPLLRFPSIDRALQPWFD